LHVTDGRFRGFVPRARPPILGTLFKQFSIAGDELNDGQLLDPEEDVAKIVVLEVVSENAFEDHVGGFQTFSILESSV
jgi:hypothetical protein